MKSAQFKRKTHMAIISVISFLKSYAAASQVIRKIHFSLKQSQKAISKKHDLEPFINIICHLQLLNYSYNNNHRFFAPSIFKPNDQDYFYVQNSI